MPMAPGSLPPCPGSSITSGAGGRLPCGAGTAGTERPSGGSGQRRAHAARQQERADNAGPGPEAAEQQAARDRWTRNHGQFLTQRMQNCSFSLDYGCLMAKRRHRQPSLAEHVALLHGRDRSGDAPGVGGINRCRGHGNRRKRRPVIQPNPGFGGMGPGRVAVGRCRVIARAALAARRASAAAIGLQAVHLTRGQLGSPGTDYRRKHARHRPGTNQFRGHPHLAWMG